MPTAVVSLVALAITALSVSGYATVQGKPPTSADLRRILETQPDFTADGISRDPNGTKEVNVGRIAKRGRQYRIDPVAETFEAKRRSEFELLRPGTYGVVTFTPNRESSSALIVQTTERRYHELLPDDDDFMEAYALVVLHPHVLILEASVAEAGDRPLEYLGEAVVDGHPCVKFATDASWGAGRTTFYAARDLRNLVIRIEWKSQSTGSFLELFPTKGDTLLRNVKLEAAADLFKVPRGFAKVDRAAAKSNEEAARQKRLRSEDGKARFYGATVTPPIVRPGTIAKVSLTLGLASSEIKPNFKWTPDAGRIVGTGQKVEFDATGLAEGEYGITYEVTDNYGHSPLVGRVFVEVREAVHDLGAVQPPFPSAGFEQVFCAVEDRSGGWYVGGKLKEFQRGIKRNIIHLLPNGTIDASFVADTGLGMVSDLAYDGTTLYAAGHPSTGSGVVALSPKTGARLPWEPGVDGHVETIELSQGTLYVGGSLSAVGGSPRRNLAAIDMATAKVLKWNPSPDQAVKELLVADTRLLVVGDFHSIAGREQSTMVAFDVSTGRMLDFETFMYPTPSSIAVHGDVVYYASGTTVAALDLRTGDPLPWGALFNGYVSGIAVSEGKILVAGSFTNVDGRTRLQVAAVDARTGDVTSWDPEADSHLWVVIPSGDRVFVGGNFETIGRQRRSKFALLDAKSGDALPGVVE